MRALAVGAFLILAATCTPTLPGRVTVPEYVYQCHTPEGAVFQTDVPDDTQGIVCVRVDNQPGYPPADR